SQQEMDMKWIFMLAMAVLLAACGRNEQSVGAAETSDSQTKNVSNSSNVVQSQSNPDSNKQSMNVKNSEKVSQSQNGRNNEQSMNVESSSNVSQSQSGWSNKQSLTIGGTSK